MNSTMASFPDSLPANAKEVLTRLVDAARSSFGENLASIVLFGSAAEGKLRATSDVNLLLILRKFEKAEVDSFREPLRLVQVALRGSAMFLLENELAAVADAFAVKFQDIVRRHRVLHGEDLLSKLAISRSSLRQRLIQSLLNTTLRLRERYVSTSLREEQLAKVIADAAGPLRAAAGTLCQLLERPVSSPKEALETVALSIDGGDWTRALEAISKARASQTLPAGTAADILLDLIRLSEAMHAKAAKLS